MLKASNFLLSLIFLTSCSIYSSTGRKQFEEKAPNSIQAFSLQSCRELSAAETWLREEFPSSSNELIELHQDYEVWGRPVKEGRVEITVFTKNDVNYNTSATKSCIYEFESKPIWLTYKKSFLDELSRSFTNLD